jgi:AraC-like DNA-binding protein
MPGFFRSTLQTTSTAGAEERLRELYGDVQLGGLGRYGERAIGDSRFSIAEVRLCGEFDVHADVDAVTVAFSTPGYAWRVRRDEGLLDAEPAVFQPDEPMSSRISGDTTVTTVTFDPAALAALAAALYGEVDLRFAGQRPVTAGYGSLWRRLVPVIADGALLENELTRATAYHALAVAALEGFRLSGERASRTSTAESRLHAYRRAARFIDEHLTLPITLADVASAAGVDEAELEAAFRAHSPRGRSPLEQLADARLAAAHRDLVAGDPTRGDTVQAIAEDNGFPHPGRFAEAYRRAYGVSPRSVLER